MTDNKTSAAELSKDIGKKAMWNAAKGIHFEVIIKDVEVFYGMPYYIIVPVAGTGLIRVRERVRILTPVFGPNAKKNEKNPV